MSVTPPPQPVSPRYKFSIAACARWETDNIVEWILFHRSIGFDHFYLYCNDDDPTDLYREILPFNAGPERLVTFHHFPLQGQQTHMLRHYLTTHRNETEWVMFLDIDEFLRLSRHANIEDFVQTMPPQADTIYFNWLFFGNNGHRERVVGSTLLNYTRRASTPHVFTKSLTRTTKLTPSMVDATRSVHFWHTWLEEIGQLLNAVNVLGEPMHKYMANFPEGALHFIHEGGRAQRLIEQAVVHHYAFRSEGEFLRRIQRGLDGQFAGQQEWKKLQDEGRVQSFLAPLNEVEDLSLQLYWADYLGQAWHNSIIPIAPGPNIAVGGEATQSSVGQWSRHQDVRAEAAGLVSGRIANAHQCHTDLEENPWWQLEFIEQRTVSEIRIYNRIDQPDIASRTRNLRVHGSLDGADWVELYSRDSDIPFGGADGFPLIIQLTQPFTCTVLRITVLGLTYLHFDQVEVYEKLTEYLSPDEDSLLPRPEKEDLEDHTVVSRANTIGDGWVNISDHCATMQSSVCEHSIGGDVATDSAGAVSGRFTGRPQFHTSNECEPWWMVDLGSIQPIGLIRIYNRIDAEVYQNRFRSFRIEGSTDNMVWSLIVREELSVPPGGLDGKFYELKVADEPRYRFVKIIQQFTEFFHLDQVQIFARGSNQIGPAPSNKDDEGGVHFWTLTTATGQRLGQRLSDGRLVSYTVVPPGVMQVHVAISAAFPNLLLLISPAPANLPLSIHSNGDPDQIIPYLIEGNHDDDIALRNPRSNRYVSVRPAEGAEVVEVTSDRIEPHGWEQFRLQEYEEASKGNLIHSVRAFAEALSQPDFSAQYLADWLRQSPSGSIATLFRPLLRMLSPIEFDRFAQFCLDPTTQVARLLASVFTADPWLAEAIPATLEWLEDRRSRYNAIALASCDIIGLSGFLGDQPISHLLSSVMRRHISARRKLCILATARDEGPYLLEWIAYHRSLGVEHFFIYTNDLTDGSDSLLKELARAGYITHIENICENKNISPQLKAYGHALSCLPEILDFEWTAIIDLDEYITIAETEHRSLQQILDSPIYASGGGVALNWQMLSPAKTKLPIVTPIIARSWRREPALNHHIKTIIRTRQCNWSGPHAPEWTFPEERIVLNPRGEDYRPHKTSASTSFSDTPCYETMWINHYFYKSFPEFVWKFSRNRGDTSANSKSFDPLPHFCEEFARFSLDSNTVADRSIEGRIAKCLIELDLLRSRPAVAQAERRMIDEVNRQLSGYLRQVASASNLPLDAPTRQLFINEALYAIAAGPIFDVVPLA